MKSNLALVKIIMLYYVIIILNKYTELKIILHNDTQRRTLYNCTTELMGHNIILVGNVLHHKVIFLKG